MNETLCRALSLSRILNSVLMDKCLHQCFQWTYHNAQKQAQNHMKWSSPIRYGHQILSCMWKKFGFVGDFNYMYVFMPLMYRRKAIETHTTTSTRFNFKFFIFPCFILNFCLSLNLFIRPNGSRFAWRFQPKPNRALFSYFLV